MSGVDCPAWCLGQEGFDQRTGSRTLYSRFHEGAELATASTSTGPGVTLCLASEDVLTIETGAVTVDQGPVRILLVGPNDTFELTAGQARELVNALQVAAAALEAVTR